MLIDIQAVKFTADQKLKDFINEKVEKLNKFHHKIISAVVYLKLENSGQVKDKIVEIKMSIPGSTLLATATDKTFEAAIDDSVETLKRQLKKENEKNQAARH
ncbi:MAG: ribosome-associated translation inhibitor RaiA [Saprospiraceae bacterium]|nr:ribosome-associated translation inhibitor RaiA [Saprospiraceae bacterium]